MCIKKATTMNNKTFSAFIALLCLLGFIIVPCVTIQSQYLVNGNISWLLIAAERLLDGQSMSAHIYETNPPLSILIYIPHILFSKALNLPPPVGAFAVTSFFVFLSATAIYCIIKPLAYLSHSQKTAFLLGHIIGITLTTTLSFSDREHFIIMALTPFALCQFLLTERTEISKKTLIPVMIIGAICILIKPHYGIVPAALIIHRMIKRKKIISIMRDIDFLTLSIATLTYSAIIALFFRDYATTIFPDVITLYTNTAEAATAIKAIKLHIIVYTALFTIECFSNDLETQKKRILLFLYTCSLLCLIPYFVQMKGFYNHIIPPYAFFVIALTLSISFRISKIPKCHEIFSFLIPVFCVTALVSTISPLNKDIVKQRDIPTLPVAKFLEKECPAPCTFFAFHGNIEIFNPTAAYMGYTHGTRFPTLWFIPGILKGLDETQGKEQPFYESLKKKYAQYLAEDLEYYAPSILIIATDINIGKTENFDFIEFFSSNPKFKKIINTQYEKTTAFEFDRAEYFKGTTLGQSLILKYQTYKRKTQPIP